MAVLQRLNAAVTHRLPMKPARLRAAAPLASVTFDDFPRSAWRVAGPILARFGANATYYAAGRFCGATEEGVEYYRVEDLAEVRAAGHEVGCHSFAHQMAPRVRTRELIADAERNAGFLGEGAPSYAYPYGEASPRTKALMAGRYETARGIRSGVNAGWTDLAQLKAVPIEHRRWRPDEIDAWLDQAVAARGWVIFFTHDVAEAPTPFGCTPAMLETVLEKVAARGIELLTVRDAAARATGRHDA